MTTYTQTTPDRILQLRHRVLRPGFPIAEVIFAEDQNHETRHYAAFDDHGEIICCVTLIPSIWKRQTAWWLRAMATTAPDWRKQGIGTEMLWYVLADLMQNDLSRPIWCNAMVESARFYRRLGWQKVSEVFVNGNAGLSVRMLRE